MESTIKGVIVFEIDGSGRWVLDLREGSGALTRGEGDDKGDDDQPEPDLVLTMSGDTFVKLVSKKMSSQQAFLTRKLKIKGSMGYVVLDWLRRVAHPRLSLPHTHTHTHTRTRARSLGRMAMKLQPVLDAAVEAPSKL